MWPEDKESARKRLRHRHTLSALVFLDVFFLKPIKKKRKEKTLQWPWQPLQFI